MINLKYDLKVLRIVYGDGSNRTPGISAEAEVYSLSKRSWGRVKLFDLHCCKPSGTSVPAFYNGAVHWIVFSYKSIRNLVMCFDFKDEKFSEIELPPVLAGGHLVNFCVNVHGDGPAIIEYFYNDFMNYCGVWVMEEYGVVESWKKLYNIELVIRMDEVIGFRKHGELLVTMLVNEPHPYDLRRAMIVSYDPKSRQIKDLGIVGWVRSLYVHNYIETLVLLEDQNGAAV